jgi:hypothetical protein
MIGWTIVTKDTENLVLRRYYSDHMRLNLSVLLRFSLSPPFSLQSLYKVMLPIHTSMYHVHMH